jgi:hypothetical protein
MSPLGFETWLRWKTDNPLSSVQAPGCPTLDRSSHIRPANDRETSRNDGNGWSIESAGQEPDSGIAGGSEIGPENTLKVEIRVQIPLGLQARTRRSAPHPEAEGPLNQDSDPGYPANIPHEIVRSQCAK